MYVDEIVKATNRFGLDDFDHQHCLLPMNDTEILASSCQAGKGKLNTLLAVTNAIGMEIHPNKPTHSWVPQPPKKSVKQGRL